MTYISPQAKYTRFAFDLMKDEWRWLDGEDDDDVTSVVAAAAAFFLSDFRIPGNRGNRRAVCCGSWKLRCCGSWRQLSACGSCSTFVDRTEAAGSLGGLEACWSEAGGSEAGGSEAKSSNS